MTKTKTFALAALALVAAGGATLATVDSAEARRFGHGRHLHGARVGVGFGIGLGLGLAAPVYAAPAYSVVAAPVRVCRTRMVIYRGVLQPVRTCRIVAAY